MEQFIKQLLESAAEGNSVGVDEALTNGAKIDSRSAPGETALLLASRNGHEELALALLKRGANAKAADLAEHNALNWAAEKGMVDLCTALLDAGVDVNVEAGMEAFQRTPLISAALKGQTKIVELLLGRGANINANDSMGRTAADVSISKACSELLR